MIKSITLICDRCGVEKTIPPSDKLIQHSGMWALIREPYICRACTKIKFMGLVHDLQHKIGGIVDSIRDRKRK